LSQVQRTDRLCDQFEAAWKAGPRPRIDAFLAGVPPAQWPDLLRELLILDLDYRRQLGQRPTLEEYQAEYPALALDRFAALFAETSQPAAAGPADATLPLSPPDGQLPRVYYLGDYELLEEIARGGMGVVYKARQISLNRVVAVKMILAGQLATQADHDRFHAEAEAAALLDHPNIVPIFEVGEHQGQHYFSMGYVDGLSLSARLAEGPLAPKEAAELAATVAEAVEYAHRQGVVHRDIKPSNILIDSHGRPRVTDFGLAKRVGAPGTPGRDSGMTATGQVLGTPSYMPPEQAAGQIRAIGPAADVYALGATLYAALTGRPPFQAATSVETLRQVIEREPVALRQLNAAVPRDLETIVLKCLEKSVPRRYAIAQAVADDLRRYLEGRPILARPVGRSERAWRWCRRQPVVAGLIAAVALTLVAGTIVSSLFAVRAFRERDRAEAGEKLAGDRLVQVAAEKQKADDEKQIAQAVRDFLQNKLLGQADARNQADALFRADRPATEAKVNPTILDLLDRAAKELAPERIEANFPNQPLIQAEILQTVGNTYFGVGEYERAIGLLRRSEALYRQHLGPEHADTLASMNNLALAYHKAGKWDLAVPLFEETLKLRKEHLPYGHPDTLASMNNLAWAYQEAGKPELAVPLCEETLKIRTEKAGPNDPGTLTCLNNLAVAYQTAGMQELALSIFKQTLDLRRKHLPPGHPDTLVSMLNLADAYRTAGKTGLAIPLCKETLDLMTAKVGRFHPETLTCMNNLALAYYAAGNQDVALQLFQETLRLREEHLSPGHPDTLVSMNNLATAYQGAGKLELAVPLFEKTRDLMVKTFGPRHPSTLTSMNNLALAYQAAGKLDLALPLFKETLDLRREHLPAGHPDTLVSMLNLGNAYREYGESNMAIPLLEQTLDLMKAKYPVNHPNTLTCMNNLALAYSETGKLDRALPLFEETLRLRREHLPAGHPDTIVSLLNLAQAYAQAGMTEKAANVAKELVAIARTRAPKESVQLAGQLAAIALLMLQAKAFAEAEPLLRECLAIREKTRPDEWTTFGSKSMLGGALLGQKKYAEAESLLLAGYEGLKQRAAKIPPQGTARVIEALERLVQLYEALDRKDQAAKWRKELEARKESQKRVKPDKPRPAASPGT
jgi:tetratricopeptide (TPR) repeat protein/tRNA A-37 threonylcarbamoyl transferase component Bud32